MTAQKTNHRTKLFVIDGGPFGITVSIITGPFSIFSANAGERISYMFEGRGTMYSPGGTASGRSASLSLSSFGTLVKSLLCHPGKAMWIAALATKTITDDSRMGSQSAESPVMMSSSG